MNINHFMKHAPESKKEIAMRKKIEAKTKKEKLSEQPIIMPELNKEEIIEDFKIKLFKLERNYNIQIEKEKLLNQKIAEIKDEMDYFIEELKNLQPNAEIFTYKKYEPYVRTWSEDYDFQF